MDYLVQSLWLQAIEKVSSLVDSEEKHAGVGGRRLGQLWVNSGISDIACC